MSLRDPIKPKELRRRLGRMHSVASHVGHSMILESHQVVIDASRSIIEPCLDVIQHVWRKRYFSERFPELAELTLEILRFNARARIILMRDINAQDAGLSGDVAWTRAMRIHRAIMQATSSFTPLLDNEDLREFLYEHPGRLILLTIEGERLVRLGDRGQHVLEFMREHPAISGSMNESSEPPHEA